MRIKQIKKVFKKPAKGSLLISEPFLEDLNFRRSVVLMTEQTELGAVGFILNKPADMLTGEVVPELLSLEFPVFYGGPMEQNSLHFIHTMGSLLVGSLEIKPGVYWGGDIQEVNELLTSGRATVNDFRFFLGYSGWAPGQLEEEIEDKAWWVTEATKELVFDNDLDQLWGNAVKELGEDYSYMANSPEDVTWN